jgi:hypothetical protein
MALLPPGADSGGDGGARVLSTVPVAGLPCVLVQIQQIGVYMFDLNKFTSISSLIPWNEIQRKMNFFFEVIRKMNLLRSSSNVLHSKRHSSDVTFRKYCLLQSLYNTGIPRD